MLRIAIHCGFPRIEPAIFCTTVGLVVVAPAYAIRIAILLRIGVVQVLGHPNLFAYFYSFINMPVAFVRHLAKRHGANA